MILIDILLQSEKRYPNKTALVMRMGYRTVSLTYHEVYITAQKISVFLQNQGLKKGDKVLILAPNSPYWICVFWGCLLGGYVPVPLNIQSTPEFLKKIADQTEAKILFKYLYYKADAPANLKIYDIELLKELLEPIKIQTFSAEIIREDDIAEIMYTSGTTGDPKGVILTDKNLGSNVAALIALIAPYMKLLGDNKFLSILPLSHIYEQAGGFLLPYSQGYTIVYAHSLAAIPDLLKEHGITIMAAVPEFLRLLMNKIEAKAQEAGKKALWDALISISSAISFKPLSRLLFYSVHKQLGGKLRVVACGGAPLDPILERKWNALGVDLLQGYGLTETAPIVSINTFLDHRLGSTGKILNGVAVSLAPDGEILVKGPNVFPKYFKNEEKTREAFNSDGWFITGDIGELDKDGFLFIRGRKKYMIKGPGAQNVYPEDIEFELNQIANVADSCVVGLEKSNGQVEIHAVLLPQNPKTFNPQEAVKLANQKLSSYQMITAWSVWPAEDFPRSATKKVKKEEVLKWLRAQSAAVSVSKAEKEPPAPLMELVSQVTGAPINQIRANTKLASDLNLTSLGRIELVARIEEKLGVAIEEPLIGLSTTIADLETMVKSKPAVKPKLPLNQWPRWRWVNGLRNLTRIFLIFPIFRTFIKLRVEGIENLKGLPRPAIFMPNHLSYLDSVVVAMALPPAHRDRLTFAAAVDVLYTTYKRTAPLAELFFNSFPFPRTEKENIRVGLEYMGRLLDKNWSCVIYPEGKTSLTGALQPLKLGAGLTAVEMDAPVVPVKIIGTDTILPPGNLMPIKRGEVIVKIGQPMRFKKSDSYIESTNRIEQALKQL